MLFSQSLENPQGVGGYPAKANIFYEKSQSNIKKLQNSVYQEGKNSFPIP